MSDDDLCGHLIRGYKGKPVRPCVRPRGHKSSTHLDAEAAVAHKAELKAWQEENAERQREYTRKFQQNHPERERKREYNREYYLANAERRREIAREYVRNNPDVVQRGRAARRARKRNVPHVDWTKQEVLDTYGRVCWLCLYPIDCDWHVDHVIPLVKGGWDVLANLRPAHSFCNLRKHDKMPAAIMQGRVWFELGVHRAGLVCELKVKPCQGPNPGVADGGGPWQGLGR